MKFQILVACLFALVLTENSHSLVIPERVLFGGGVSARVPVVLTPSPIVRVVPRFIAPVVPIAPVIPVARVLPVAAVPLRRFAPIGFAPVAGFRPVVGGFRPRLFKRESTTEVETTTGVVPAVDEPAVPEIAEQEEIFNGETVPDIATDAVPEVVTTEVSSPELVEELTTLPTTTTTTTTTEETTTATTTTTTTGAQTTTVTSTTVTTPVVEETTVANLETTTVSATEPVVTNENKTLANCSIENNLLNCTGPKEEHNFACEVVPQLAHLKNLTIDVANLIIKPEVIKDHESLRLLMKVPAERFSITNATVRAYTFINRHLNQTKETLSIYSSKTLPSLGFQVKDNECFSQLVSLAKNILIEQFRIFVYLHQTAPFA